MKIDKKTIENSFKDLQDAICNALEKEDGSGKFEEDLWQRPGGGGGRTRIIRNGSTIEKGGVNFSAVHGTLPENIKKALKLDESSFYATGVSIVIHPNNPFVPIIHMNVRYFEIDDRTWWFGGGIDLTPHYINENEARFFHTQLANSCNKHHPDFYNRFKQWADDYFYIPHRKETRGIGGIFFDKLGPEQSLTKEQLFAFVMEIGNTFAPTYCSLMHQNSSSKFTEAQKQWQLLRRGRYVEFNLVYDKGTKFGLETEGRIESILMSLPQLASWEYNPVIAENSPEAQTLNFLKKGINWI